MSITAKQRSSLHELMVKAFTPDDLKTLLFTRLEIHLHNVTGGGPLPKIVADIIEAAEQQDWLPNLTRALAAERPKNVALVNRAAEIETMVGQAVEKALIEELKSIVTPGRIPVDAVRNAYTYFITPNMAYDIDIHDLADPHVTVVTHLGRAGKGSEEHPLLRFVTYLAQQKTTSEATRRRLDGWIGSAIAAWELRPTLQNELRAEVAETVKRWKAADLHLLIAVGRRAGVVAEKGTAAYEVSGWRLLTDDDTPIGPMVRVGEQRPCETDDVVRMVMDEIRRLQWARRLTRTFAVELFLPIELMPVEIDQTMLELPDEEPSPLGSRFLLYLRSWERIFDPALYDIRTEWEARWEEKGNGWRAWKADRTVFDENKFASQLRAQKASHVALTFSVLPPDDYGRPRGVIWKLIAAGTPIALWLRADQPDYAALLDSLVAADDWRKKVFESREAAAACASKHCGSQLVLLWDDPRHRPPYDPRDEQFMEMDYGNEDNEQ